MRVFRTLLVAALAALTSCTGHEAPAASQAPDSVHSASVSAVANAMKSTGTPGAQVLVIRKGQVLLDRGFGVRSLDDRTPVDVDTRFEIGSITKEFTAAAVLQLVEQKKLSLDDTLGKFVPDYPAGASITLRQLLWQVSGIPNYTAVRGFDLYSLAHAGGLEDILGLIQDKPLEFKPGTRWMYSNTNYALLGYVVEAASGTTWETYIREHIFVPAGMTHSTFNDHEAAVPDMATGYIRQGGRLFPSPNMRNWPVGAGAIVSTARDLSKWDEAFFDGRIVSPEHLKLATTPGTLTDGSPTGYGFGWLRDRRAGQTRVWHSGGTRGFVSVNETYPELGERIIVLLNDGSGNPAGTANAVFNALNPEIAAEEEEAAPGEDPAVTKLAQEWWKAFARGKIDRSGVTPAVSSKLTPAVVKRGAAPFRTLGAPKSWVYRSKRESNGVTVYVYHVIFQGDRALDVTMALTADGKLAGYLAQSG